MRYRATASPSIVERRSSQFPWNGKVKAIARLNARIPESGMQPEETSIDRIACPKTIFVSDEISSMRRRTRKFATSYEHWPSLYVLFYFTPNGLVPPCFPTFIAGRLAIPFFPAKSFPRYSGLVGQLFLFFPEPPAFRFFSLRETKLTDRSFV